MEAKRLQYVDICRGFAILSILFAHTVGYSGELIKIRTFDVCLLVFLSGYVSSVRTSFWNYLKKRTLRLMVPVWFFLTIYFSFSFILNLTSIIDYQVTLGNVLGSFSLINGIGYVWVIRVFLIVSLIGYFIHRFFDKERFKSLIIFSIFLVCTFFLASNSDNRLITWFILEPFPYIIPFVIGLSFNKYHLGTTIDNIIIITSVLVSIFIYYFYSDFLIKYPPSLLYISYGCTMSVFIFLILRNHITKIFNLSYISFFGTGSMSIYLWHIPMAKYFEKSYVEFNVIWQWLFMLISGVVLSSVIIIVAGHIDRKFGFSFKHWLEG
ncbi:acyltransferase family protein [Vibrio splendidus]